MTCLATAESVDEKDRGFFAILGRWDRRGQPGLGDLSHYSLKKYLPSAYFCCVLFLPLGDRLQGLEYIP